MKTKIKITSIFGDLLFEHESDDNNIVKTLKKALAGGVNLRNVDLRNTDLSDVNFRSANLRDADLRGVNFSGANLYGVSFSGANLYGANLYDADLRSVNFRDTDLSDVNFRNANLRDSDFRGADFRDADLRGANIDFLLVKIRCGFGFAKTCKKIRMQLIAHTASFFVNSSLDKEEKILLESMKKYCKGWHREDEFGRL